jgi:hypothetical protein
MLLLRTIGENKCYENKNRIGGIDPGFGSSAFGIVVILLINSKIQIIFADEYERLLYPYLLCGLSRPSLTLSVIR